MNALMSYLDWLASMQLRDWTARGVATKSDWRNLTLLFGINYALSLASTSLALLVFAIELILIAFGRRWLSWRSRA